MAQASLVGDGPLQPKAERSSRFRSPRDSIDIRIGPTNAENTSFFLLSAMQNTDWPSGAFPFSSDPIQLEGGRWRPRVVIKIKRAGQEVAERVYELPSVSFATPGRGV